MKLRDKRLYDTRARFLSGSFHLDMRSVYEVRTYILRRWVWLDGESLFHIEIADVLDNMCFPFPGDQISKHELAGEISRPFLVGQSAT